MPARADDIARMTSLDVSRVTALIEETAAEEVLPRWRALAAGDVRRKSDGDLVTVADEACEARLSSRLLDLLPGSVVVGEEAAHAEPKLLARLKEAAPAWVIDPVDGTVNFSEGRPAFAVMVALARAGQVLASWIHEPVAGRTAVAEAGQGAWIGSRRLTAAKAAPVGSMRGTLHAGNSIGAELAQRVRERRERVGAIKSLRCAGAEYLRLAAGEMHYTLFSRMMPWDHAPGILIHREAGGWARTLDDRPYDPAEFAGPGLLMAPDAESWQALHAALFAPDPIAV